MSAAKWVDQESAEAAYYADRYSIDLIGTEEIPTTSGFNVGVAYYTAEEFGEPQVHEDQEAVYVVSGVGEIKVGDEVVALKPGIAVYVPPGTAHGGRRAGAGPVMVVYAHGAV
jgi:mannose-6-phosphate isomerase-like protein (cupin superfamily)